MFVSILPVPRGGSTQGHGGARFEEEELSSSIALTGAISQHIFDVLRGFFLPNTDISSRLTTAGLLNVGTLSRKG